MCRVPLSTSFLILCRERKHRDAQGNSSSGHITEGIQLKMQTLGLGKERPPWSIRQLQSRGSKAGNPKQEIQSRDSKQGYSCDVPGFLPEHQEGLSRLQHRFLGICGSMETTGCRNKLSQGIKTNWFANKGRMGSTEETEEPRSCLLLCPRQEQVLSRG